MNSSSAWADRPTSTSLRTAARDRAWLAVVVWAALIFVTSTESFSRQHTRRWFETVAKTVCPSVSRDSLRALHRTARNLAHPAEYFVLVLLLARAFRASSPGAAADVAMRSILVAVLYAFTDEAHQAFVDGRSASIADCADDTLGAALAALSSTLRRRNA